MSTEFEINHSGPERWEHFFKPEVRSSGRAYVSKGVVMVSRPSDTEVSAIIRVSSPVRMTFKVLQIESPMLYTDCSCPAAKKGQLCKHIWAGLLKISERFPEFLQERTGIEKMNSQTDARVDREPAFKAKQSEYRKAEYQRQKQRLKEQKQGGKKSYVPAAPQYPEDIQEALDYFKQNGFEFSGPLESEVVQLAKRKLSRIFHPDVGGSHAEIIELNKNSEVLLEFIQLQN